MIVALNAVSGRAWPHDPQVRKWAFWIVGRGLEVGWITPEASPMLGPTVAAGDELPDEEDE